MKFFLIALCLIVLTSETKVEAKVLTDCEAVAELQRANIKRSLISNWVCLMRSASGLDTRLVTGPKTASSYNFGILQISSLKWCSRGHSGGICNKRCEDFANDDIQDDIKCAEKIIDNEGFKAWDSWEKNCKKKALPNIRKCLRR